MTDGPLFKLFLLLNLPVFLFLFFSWPFSSSCVSSSLSLSRALPISLPTRPFPSLPSLPQVRDLTRSPLPPLPLCFSSALTLLLFLLQVCDLQGVRGH